MIRTIQLALAVLVATLLSSSLWGQGYTFRSVSDPSDPTSTQLLGINNAGTIAGYYGATHNKGFTFVLPSTFTAENYPGSAQTQVTGIDSKGETCGFYVDSKGVNHGFLLDGTKFRTIDDPGASFNHLLGRNDLEQVAGFYKDTLKNGHAYISATVPGGVFEVFTFSNSLSVEATGINNSQWVTGFYTDAGGNSHGFLLRAGTFKTVDFPDAIQTMARGLNNKDQVVGSYIDMSGFTHGFVYNLVRNTFTTIDHPDGVGSSVANGINDSGAIVGFYVNLEGNTEGFVATP